MQGDETRFEGGRNTEESFSMVVGLICGVEQYK